ncbi:hypothetical protein QE152_g29934 [Popillia japonica]|uniref:PHD-type domain-containing protein n=1 Tax=Popillia japonica TaxID=7064 RepID=A0AAW1JGL3_POPJA
MPKCDVCSQNVSRYDDCLMCSSITCAKTYHIKCVKVDVELLDHLKTSGDIRNWTCETCKSGYNLSSQSTEINTNVQLPTTNNVLDISNVITAKVKKKELSNLNTENCNLKEQVQNLKEHVNYYSSDGRPSSPTSEVDVMENTKQKQLGHKTRYIRKTDSENNQNNNKQQEISYATVLKKSDKLFISKQKTNNPTTIPTATGKDKVEEFELAVNRRKLNNKNKTIKGSASNTQLKAVTKYSYLYVTRLDKDVTADLTTIVAGDFNIDFLKSDQKCKQFLHILDSFGAEITIKEPTRGTACLDNIFVLNGSLNLTISGARTLSTSYSDHKAQEIST